MTTYRIAVLGGDGVGPEVVSQGLKVLNALEAGGGFATERVEYDLGGRRYLRTGEVLSEETLAELKSCDALYMGAVGTPEIPPGILERGLLLKLRFALDLYVNLRPVKLYPGVASPISGLTPDRCDLVVVRENTEGAYAGAGGSLYRGTPEEVATEESVNTRHGVARVIRYAFELAVRRAASRGPDGRAPQVTLVHKTNVLSHAGDLWSRAFEEIGVGDFPDVVRDYVHVDAACLYLTTEPERFDVVVTENLFGDIITDLGAAVQGGLGLAASANLDPQRRNPSLFEPVHGSAPDLAGTGKADPTGAVLSLAELLAFLGERTAAERVQRAVARWLAERGDAAGDGVGYSTEEAGDRLAELAGS